MRAKQHLALGALALGAFVIGTAELVIVGILDLVATDLRVGVGTAGLLVTAYALGISLGGPLLTIATLRFSRRRMLLLALAAYVAGNALVIVATGFGLFVLARVVTGSLHGLFIGVASVVAARLVPPEHRGRAMSMVFGGIAVSTVLGVPLGTVIGRELGWQAAFVGIVALGVVAFVATLFLVPPVGEARAAGFSTQARSAFAPRVLAMLGVGLLLLGGQFTAFTYLATYLEKVTGISGSMVSVFLLAYGIASALGTFGGGRLADRGPDAVLLVANVTLILALGVLYLGGSIPVLAAVALAVWGLVGFGLVPSLQLRVVSLAGPGADLAATLGASAVNAGIAVGAFAGGRAEAGHGASATVVTALVICAAALPATWATRYLTSRPGEVTIDAAGTASLKEVR
ncbi:MFS transporter [Streptomyces sp. NPDC020192]|uniref:MFS transporter n=1 Tax=Streptomyces sp. NPDC020192 TaxID=3365066 RepID=UPI00379455CE